MTLLERGAELARLEGALAAARAGNGSLVLIRGAAGIGKTELLEAAHRLAAEAGMTTAVARGAELERELAFGIVRQLFEPHLTTRQDEQRAFTGAAALARPIFTGEPLESGGSGSPEPTLSAIHGLYWLSWSLARERPLLVVIDDAHWADSVSLQFLAYLSRRLDDMPMAVVVASRPAETESGDELLRRLSEEPSTISLSLDALSPEAVSELTATTLGRSPDAAFTAACHRASGGVPLLLRELLRVLADRDVEPTASFAGDVERIGPQTVADYVIVRLQRLGPDAVAVARSVAILGGDAALHRVMLLAGLEEIAATDALDRLARAEIIAPAQPLAFVQPLVRSAVYNELAPGERARMHKQAAALLGAEQAASDRIAAHLLATLPVADGNVVEALRRAAETASARAAPPSAVAYLERALAEPPAPDARPIVLYELGTAEVHAGRPDRSAEHLREAHRLAPPGRPRTEIALTLAGCLRLQWHYREAAEVIATTLEEIDDEALALALRAELMQIDALEPEPGSEPRRSRRAAPGPAEPSPGAGKYLAARTCESVVRSLAPAAEALELGERARRARITEDLKQGGSLWINAVAPVIIADGFDLAEAMIEEAFALADARASLIVRTRGLVARSLLRLRCGDLADAQADAETAVAAGREAQLYFTLLSVSVLLDVHSERGELDAAETLLTEAAMSGEIADTFVHNWILLSRGRLRLAQGELGQAVSDLEEMERRLERRQQLNPAVHPHRSSLALALLGRGERDRALRLAEAELEAARRWGARRAIGISLRAVGLCERREKRIDRLRESAAILEGSGAELELAHSLVALGSALRRAGSRSDAREPLRAGMEAAHRLGALALVERAREELLATGARPRRIMRTGVDALTPSELRVARLAAGGMTNREIAQALFVTPRTVEGHLTHAFQKLEISSRDELGDRLAA